MGDIGGCTRLCLAIEGDGPLVKMDREGIQLELLGEDLLSRTRHQTEGGVRGVRR